MADTWLIDIAAPQIGDRMKRFIETIAFIFGFTVTLCLIAMAVISTRDTLCENVLKANGCHVRG